MSTATRKRRLAGLVGLGCAICLLLPAAGNAQNTNMGSTYAELEAQVTRLTTQFVDAYAITQRTPTGDLETVLYTADGAKLTALSVAVADRVVELEGAGGAKSAVPFELTLDPPTSDWANVQIYNVWRDLEAEKTSSKGSGAPAREPSWEWRENYLRLVQSKDGGAIAAKADNDRAEDRILGVMTRFGDVEAVSTRQGMPATGLAKDGNAAILPTFSTRLVDQRTGQPLGRASWFETTKTFAWNLPGLTSGFVNEQRMEQSFPFQPNQAWSNIQVFGFWQMHLALAVRNSNDPYAKNEPGCDGLHWLDNTVFRPCCDRHDLCYEKYGCSASSWWFFGSSWRCIHCNLSVVFCFLTGGGGGGTGGGGCGDGGDGTGIDYQCPY